MTQTLAAPQDHFDSIFLNFFGVSVEVHCHRNDIDEVRFMYKRYLCSETSAAEVYVRLECSDWPDRGFFTSLLSKDKLKKRITIKRRDGGAGALKEFTEWSDIPSPLPPFYHSQLWERLATYPGAIIRLSDGSILAIIGSNYVGKTSVALNLCEAGASLISDSLMIFDRATRECLTFQVPLGFRRKSLANIIPRLSGLDHRLTVSPDTGLVALLHVEDVLYEQNSPGGIVSHVVCLKRHDSSEYKIEQIETPELGWFSGNVSSITKQLLPHRMTDIYAPLNAAPSEIARTIDKEIVK